MTDKLRLEMKVADLILAVADSVEDLTRSDLQGVAHAKAMEIIALVRESS